MDDLKFGTTVVCNEVQRAFSERDKLIQELRQVNAELNQKIINIMEPGSKFVVRHHIGTFTRTLEFQGGRLEIISQCGVLWSSS